MITETVKCWLTSQSLLFALINQDGALHVKGTLTIKTPGSAGNIVIQFDYGSGTNTFSGSGAITGLRCRIEGPTMSGSTMTGKVFIEN